MQDQYPYPYYQTTYPNYYYPTTSPAYYPIYQQPEYRQQQPTEQPTHGMLPMEQSYIENILRLNQGKKATVYMTIEKNTKKFVGNIEAAGRDHIILSDPNTGKRYLLLMVYLDYVVFDEEIEYEYSFANANQQMTTYPQR